MLGGIFPRITGNSKNTTVNGSIENLGIRTKQVIDEFNRYLIWKPHLPKKFKKYSLLHQFRFSYAFIIFWHETDYSEYLFSGRKSDLVVTGTLIDFKSIKTLISSIPRNFNLNFFQIFCYFWKSKISQRPSTWSCFCVSVRNELPF